MNLQQLYKVFLDSSGVSTDSRKPCEGMLFFSLTGKTHNANQYAAQALNKGAAAAVIDDENYWQEGCILVEDVLESLQRLATFHRQQVGLKSLLGITGSNGKTTTKELIARVLQKKYKVLATDGNYNNHFGVPLTLLRMTAEHEMAVIEMGANRPGDIKALCKIARPDCGIITNVGRSHLEELINLEGVRKEKSQLFKQVLNRNGTLILDRKEKSLAGTFPPEAKTYAPVIQLSMIRESPHLLLEVQIDGNTVGELSTHLVGRYNLQNIRYAIASGLYYQVPIQDILSAIASYQPQNMRSQTIDIGRARVILDAYNANPDSVRFALENLSAMEGENKAVFLGEMLELGEHSVSLHQEIVDQLSEGKFSPVVLIGASFGSCTLPKGMIHYDRVEDARKDFDTICRLEFTVLVKGSRSVGMEALMQ
ncbi:MAG TPA: UDP-N-acetylmuramoyl-tripeptide--D-alanyl-D-alanine ligase [Saprospiraceae bacterium]|nr:UDP-N-acetylmuramoyl-tripeptide--D-alanyl-D-alanine ligase [Saprospiraceae bacterium]